MKLKERIKNLLFTDEVEQDTGDFATTKELVYFCIMSTFIAISIVIGIYAYTVTIMTNDLVERVQTQELTIDGLQRDAAQYKMMYEDIYQTYVERPQFEGIEE